MADLVDQDWTFQLPAGELARPDVPRGIVAKEYHGKEVEDCCIAQLDFLGFSNVLREACGRAPEMVQSFYQQVELHARIGARAFRQSDEPEVAIFQYADTVNLVARDPGDAGIAPVVLATTHLLASCHGKGLPARAGISMGEVWAISPRADDGSHGDFVSGPALARVHVVEGAQAWAGGALDPHCAGLMEAEPTQQLVRDGWLIQDVVPWKRPGAIESTSYALNWPRVLHVPDSTTLDVLMSLTPRDLENPLFAEGCEYRRKAVEFYHGYGAGPLADHRWAWMKTPFGFALPLAPAMLPELLETEPTPPPEQWPAVEL